jgi:hypothetical protein
METKVASKDGRVGVSISRQTAHELLEIKDELIKQFGINLSFTQVIEYLIKQHKTRQSDQ